MQPLVFRIDSYLLPMFVNNISMKYTTIHYKCMYLFKKKMYIDAQDLDITLYKVIVEKSTN